jgi:predicted MFS family arabinose efflux permease
MTPAAPVSPPSGPDVGNTRWYVVTVLFLVTVANFMDRQLLAILLEPIKRELGASDTQMGLLTGFAFVAFFTVASVPIARAADRYSRRNIIAAALAFWSAMTIASGFVLSFMQLAAARIGLGISEAASGPAAHSIISDVFTRTQRTAALSLIAVAAPVGTMVAFVAGGVLNESVGWRTTLIALGAPGLLLTAIVLTFREPRRGATDDWVDTGRPSVRETASYLWGLRSLRSLTAGASLSLLAAWAMATWSAPFLMRVHGMNTEQAGAWLGLTNGGGGILGTVVGGFITQRLARTDPAWMLRFPAVTSLLAAPFVVLFLTLPAWAAPVMNLGAAVFGSCLLGPVLAVTQLLAKVRMRSIASALVAVTFNLVGAGIGPLIVGALSDLLAPAFGTAAIRYALLVPATTSLLAAGYCFARGAQHVQPELERALA